MMIDKKKIKMLSIIGQRAVLGTCLFEIEKDFKNCFCAVSYSSGSTVDAVLAGVPVLATDPGNMAWDVSTHELNKIESRYLGDRLEWMQKISMCQWSMEEFENGECWNHIKKSL